MAVKRIMGIETEYGISGANANEVVNSYKRNKKDHIDLNKTNSSIIERFEDRGYSYSHQYYSPYYTRYDWQRYEDHDRTINNGARFYIDMGHPEYSTPETSNPRDLVIADKAGERIVQESAENTGKGTIIYKNNSDGSGHSYGCHENYLTKRFTPEEFENLVVPAIVPFFVTRQIFIGSGKIGVENPRDTYFYRRDYSYSKEYNKSENWLEVYREARDKILEALENLGRHFLDMPEFTDIEKNLLRICNKREELGQQEIFQLSQRADFIETLIGLQTTYDRPIVNTRDEAHADRDKYMRLHVICGDANLCEFATYLKAGTTALVLDMIEEGIVPIINLRDPIKAMRQISWDQSRKWIVDLANENKISAIEIQREYLNMAKNSYNGRDAITNDILDKWEKTLKSLESNPMELVGKIDWVTKLYLLTYLMEKDGINLTSTKIRNAALQYHNINMKEGLFYFMQDRNLIERIVSDEEIEHAIFNPPTDTRAFLRGKALSLKYISSVDWGGFTVNVDGVRRLVSLDEPFSGTEKDIGYIFNGPMCARRFIKELESKEGISIESLGSYSYNASYHKSKNRNYKKTKKEGNKNAREDIQTQA